MDDTPEARSWADGTYGDVGDVAEQAGSTMIVPVGSVEQHGHHLPVSTDTLLADAVVRASVEHVAEGSPVLATPVSGVPDVVREEETGFFLREVEPAAIATQCERILQEHDLAAISQRGREHILDEYSFEAAVSRYEQTLQTVCRNC
jgi:glycosyltransferase involved in cell wall biosynthesis